MAWYFVYSRKIDSCCNEISAPYFFLSELPDHCRRGSGMISKARGSRDLQQRVFPK